MRTLFDPKRPFFKGNLHMHTTRSDGRLSPEEALWRYQARGYDFVAVTDHWKACEAGRVGDMTVLPGTEMHVLPDVGQTAHIVGIGFDPNLLALSERRKTAQQLIDMINEAGGIAILAHPAWSLNTSEFILSLRGLGGVEIYNTFSGLPWNPGRADSSGIVDLVATQRRLLPLVASDDSHRYDGEEGVGATFVNASGKSPDAIMEALRAGRFYASQGPAFEQITVDGRDIEVACSPCEHAVFYSNLQRGAKSVKSGRDQTKIAYLAGQGERFLRIELIDRFGRRAWASPFPLEQS